MAVSYTKCMHIYGDKNGINILNDVSHHAHFALCLNIIYEVQQIIDNVE